VVAEASSIATSLDQLYYAGPRFTFFALGTFACTGLLLAAVGVFGLIGYTVVLRRHEIAVRVAVGAQRGDILIMILRKVLSLFAFGTVVGLVLAVWASRVLRNEVWGISASDPLTVVTVVVALATVVLVGSLLPVWRATHLNPMSTLHHE
jgi:putative ABC transport system permease protein